MGLNSKQKEAVEYLEGPLLVLAGPGTGKTQLLSEKVAYILKNTDTNPENILCMTFTESGAMNMRERLKTIVGNDGMKVHINTYHAFGADILAQYKAYTDKYDRRLDSAIDEVNQFKIIKSIQDSLDGNDILRGDAVRDIISVISEAKSAGLTASDLQSIAEQNIEDSKVLSSSISPLLMNVVPRVYKESYEKAYLPIYELIKDYKDSVSVVSGIERLIGGLARNLHEAIVEAESTQKIKPLSAWKDSYFEKDAKGNYRLRDRIANKKLLSIANVMRKYDTYLSENGLYDFDDMIEESVKALKNDAGFKATLSERYQFIMLDEFQDTNPSQFAIIKELTDYEKPMVMAVGDDDQAIYEFQGALSTNLTDFQEYYSAHVIPLVENYRSTQEILDFSRKIINQAPDRFADKELISHQKSPTVSQIYRHEFLSSDMEYQFIADEIAKLIRAGVSQKDIAIISYKTKYFLPLLPYLQANPEIKIAYEKKDNLFEDEKMHELFMISRLIHELANAKKTTVSLLELFTFPCLDLPVIQMIKLMEQSKREKRPVFDLMLESSDDRILNAAQWFTEMIPKSFSEPLELFLKEILEKLQSVKMDSYERFRLYENAALLLGKIKQHFGEKSYRLQDLITFLDDYNTASLPINVNSPYKDSDEAVSILSAHKAKGLEFLYVFIISADHTAWGKGKGNNNLLSLPKNLARIRHTGMTDGERLRILYVALTRAKKGLYITNSLHDFNDKSPARLEYLNEYAEGDRIVSPLLPNSEVILHYESDIDKISQHVNNWLTTYTKAVPNMRLIYKERVKNWRMSASSLTSFIDIVYAGPEDFFKSYILRTPMEPESEALAFGDLVHKVFEVITNEGLNEEQAIDFYLDGLNKKDLPPETLKKLREKGPSDLSVAISEFKDLLYSGKAEVDFSAERLVVDGIPVTGKIDHILVDEKSKSIEVFDYKTGNFHKEKWQSHTTLFKYMLQLEFYKLLLNNSSKYRNYKVEKAHILFVVPDKDGQVYDKVYEYSDEDGKYLRKIMRAVYKQISTLSFLDDEEIMVAANPSLGIKDIKKFIELLLAKNEEL